MKLVFQSFTAVLDPEELVFSAVGSEEVIKAVEPLLTSLNRFALDCLEDLSPSEGDVGTAILLKTGRHFGAEVHNDSKLPSIGEEASPDTGGKIEGTK